MIDINELRRLAHATFAEPTSDNILDLHGALDAVEIIELLDRLEAAEEECNALRTDKATLQQMTYSLKDHLEAAEKERDELRAKVAEMEKQEPVAEMVDDDFGKQIKGINYWWRLQNGAKLYALPGAKGEGK